MPEKAAGRRGSLPIPPVLVDAAGWVWRLALVAAAAYGVVWLAAQLYLVTLPFIAALLVTALVHPVAEWLRARGLGRLLSTWVTFVLGFVVLGALVYFIVTRIRGEANSLATQFNQVVDAGRTVLQQRFGVSPGEIDHYKTEALHLLRSHTGPLASGVLTGIGLLGSAVTGLILTMFIGFFLLYDGDGIWSWLVGLFPSAAHGRVRAAGREAWSRLSGYVRGTFLVGCFHGVVVAITLTALGAPLIAPLALLVFLGSFLPIIGALVFGGLSVLVVLLTKGLVAGLILLGVLVAANQVEAHLLQPFLVGRYVRLHPLAVLLLITAGGLVGGIIGAILAIPLASVAYGAAQVLASDQRLHPVEPPRLPRRSGSENARRRVNRDPDSPSPEQRR